MNHFIFINKEPLKLENSVEVTAGTVIPAVQLAPFGDFPCGEVLQHLTRESFEDIVRNWEAAGKPELLVDFEHKSEAGGSEDTSAAAWASNVAVDDELGLVADFTLTDLGAEALGNRRLRFLSPVFGCKVDRWADNKEDPAEVTPVELVSVALTNTPNLPVRPILNKAEPEPQPVEDTKDPAMDKIKEALGLAPEATEEEVLNAIGECLKAKNEAEEAKAAAEKEALEQEAEQFAEENAKKCNKEVLKAQYLANKEVARALVAGIPEAKEEPQVILNKGKEPAVTKETVVAELNKLHGADKIAFANKHAAELFEAAK